MFYCPEYIKLTYVQVLKQNIIFPLNICCQNFARTWYFWLCPI